MAFAVCNPINTFIQKKIDCTRILGVLGRSSTNGIVSSFESEKSSIEYSVIISGEL